MDNLEGRGVQDLFLVILLGTYFPEGRVDQRMGPTCSELLKKKANWKKCLLIYQVVCFSYAYHTRLVRGTGSHLKVR